MPPWLALALGAITAIALALTFRYEGIESRVLREAPQSDALHMAYMSAWLAAHPAEHGLRLRLARDLTRIGEFDRARAELWTLEQQIDTLPPALGERVALQSLDVDIAALFAIQPSDPQRAEALELVHERLRRMTLRAWTPATEAELAEQAASVGADRPAMLWYTRALERNAPQPPSWWAQAGRNMVALRQPDLAARLLLRARSLSRNLDEERNYFIAALQALRTENRLQDALALADAQIGRLIADTATLEYLTRLALAAGRPDVAQRYATLMLKLSLLREVIAAWQQHSNAPLPPQLGRVVHALDRILPPSLVRVQAQAQAQTQADEDERRPQLPFDEERYRLSFDVFLANGNLRDALAVARSAVRQAPKSLEWRRRLAQVADFSGNAPLALEQWHAIAKMTNDEAAWVQVEKRAPGAFDYRRLLDAVERRLKRSPEDLTLLRRVVELNELLGEPERAVATLQQYARGTQRAAVLRELANLAERMGDIALRRSALTALNREFGPDIELALAIAELDVARGDRAAAFAVLRGAETLAKPDDVPYWEAYADLAVAAGDRVAALRALMLLIDGGRASINVLLDAASLLEQDEPQRSAALVLRAHQQAPSLLLANRLLGMYERNGDRGAAFAFLQQLDPARRALYERDPGFLQQRAILWMARDEPQHAAVDLQRALALSPGNTDLIALRLWALVAAHDAQTLRATLTDLAPLAGKTPELWGPVGAAWLALNEPGRALPWLQQQVKAKPGDYLWLLNLADATELNGDVERAWRLRLHAWRKLRALPVENENQRREVQTRLATLAPVYEPGDAARARLRTMLADRLDPTAREAAVAILLSTEQSELAQAWLLARYTRALTRPTWAELTIALAHDDRARIEELLDTLPDWLPLYDRVEAAQRAGRPALAQTLAFDGLAAHPDNEPLHARLSVNTLPRADFVGAAAQRFSQRPLRETSIAVDALESLSPRLQLGAAYRSTSRSSSDTQNLIDALPVEHTSVVTLHALTERNGRVRAQVDRSDGARTRVGFALEGDLDLTSDLRLLASVTRRAAATDTAYLRIAGERDSASIGVQGRIATREFFAAEAALHRYRADGAPIGRGHRLQAEVGHHLRLAYPGLTLRASVIDTRTRADAGRNDLMGSLVPPAVRPSATNATFLPADNTRVALSVVFGDSARATPQRAWRPFGTFSLVNNRARSSGPLAAQSVGGYEWTLGLTGGVFGTDQLTLTIDGGSSTGANANPYTQVALRYRWLH